MQQSLLPVHVLYEVDSRTLGLDGADLKRVAHGDDGADYAAKRLQDGPLIPLSEWVGHHLWRDCGLLTPDFAILRYNNGQSPAFGSRIEVTARQIVREPTHLTIAGFFTPHADTISRCYPLDAFFINPDRHGRNFLARPALTRTDLLCFDYSRAWAADAAPTGEPAHMRAAHCHSLQWWQFFTRRLHLQANFDALDKALALPRHWLRSVFDSADDAWLQHIDADAALDFWHHRRTSRAQFARDWSQSPCSKP